MIGQIDKDYISIRPFKLYARLISYLLFEGRPLTTKGRWINRFVFANYKLGLKIISDKAKVDEPIFILGTGRSGTTMLGILLSMHKDVGFLNEPKAIWNFLYPFEDLQGNYTLAPAQYRLAASSISVEAKKAAHSVYKYYLSLSMSKRVVDKYPELIFRYPFVKEIFPDARFIFLIRNGIDTCLSIKNWSERLGIDKDYQKEDWWGINDRKWKLLVEQIAGNDAYFKKHKDEILGINSHLDRAALEWVLTMKEGLKLKEKNDVLFLRYEDLTKDFEHQIEIVLKHCLLGADQKLIEYGKKTIKSDRRNRKENITLHPIIKVAFDDMMKQYNYD